MEERSSTQVMLYVETREDAETMAQRLRSEGFESTIGRPKAGRAWSMDVTGDEQRLQELAERIQRELRESD